MKRYFRPLPCAAARKGSWALGGGTPRFSEVEVIGRDGSREVLPIDAAAAIYPEAGEILERAASRRSQICGLDLASPKIMGVVNVTPDSFSDGGLLAGTQDAVEHGLALAAAGADILDIGGESTRPGAQPVPIDEEVERVVGVIAGLAARTDIPISIDTRNAAVAEQALSAGARMLNDVSALTHDAASIDMAKSADATCLMHAQGDPRTMQDAPAYDDVLLDVYDYLADRVDVAEAAGIRRSKLVVDPGIGFGKTLAHNLALLNGLSLFQGLGCSVLLGVSRKGFIGRLSGEKVAANRAPGSIAAGLAGLAHGVQILRVHDVAETVQAVRVWQAIQGDTNDP